MSEHSHKNLHGEALLAAAQKQMQAAKEQWTQMREKVFAALAAFDRPVSAYDVADKVSAERGKRVAPNSVYRILDLFVDNNLARRVESANAYIVNPHPGCAHDCIFMVCNSCGQAMHIDNDSLSGQVREAAEKSGYTEVRPVIEVRGICRDCG